MALINWDDKYSVKIKEIDNQHQKLVRLINLLHDAMKEGKGKQVVGKILNDLVDYTVFHFAYEEKLFDRYSYPGGQTHKLEHNDLVQKVKKYVNDFQSEKPILPMEVMNFLQNWLINHINGTDKKYSSFLIGKGVA